MVLVGPAAGILPADLITLLREQGLRLELHDRDPKPAEPKDGGAAAAAAGDDAMPSVGDDDADKEDADAPFPPHGVGQVSLAQLLPRRPTEGAYYARQGIPTSASRHASLCINVLPCERPKKKPEPEEDNTEYFAGGYVEHGTCLSLKLELATPLPPESDAHADVELQRIATLIRYNDTQMLHALLSLINETNTAIGMNSASAWEAYKESKRDDLDLITGLQLVDSEVRLFILEGHAAKGTNGMAKLHRLLERIKPNSNESFTLMDTTITFPERLYADFEMPTKMFKLRATLPHLLSKPEVFEHLRVPEGAKTALMALSRLLTSPSMRLASKYFTFPKSFDMLQLEKKYGGVHLIADREGVAPPDDEEDDESSIEEGGGVQRRQRRTHRRKELTDCQNPQYMSGLEARKHLVPINWLQRNMDELPHPMPRAPLPQWYLETIPRLEGPAYPYSGQRMNQTEVQKAAIRKKLEEMAKQEKIQMSYHSDLLWADNMGEREMPAPPDPSKLLPPWDTTAKVVHNRDGTKSLFRMLQPSDNRVFELQQPQDVDSVVAQAEALKRSQIPGPRPRFDSNPCPAKPYMEDGYPGQSIFQQTEQMIAAEHKERVDGAIETWINKLVVDDPVVHVDLRVRDRPPQQDRTKGILADAPKKKSIKKLYRGKMPLTYGDSSSPEPSIFMHESTIDQLTKFETSLRPYQPQKWSGTKDFNSTMCQAKSDLPQTVQSKKLIQSLTRPERSGPLYTR